MQMNIVASVVSLFFILSTHIEIKIYFGLFLIVISQSFSLLSIIIISFPLKKSYLSFVFLINKFFCFKLNRLKFIKKIHFY